MPRKVFVAGEVLTAADVNTNLMDQAVMVFADSGARGSAIGSAVEGMVTYLEDTDQLEVYGGTATGWTSASNVLFGTAVPSDGQVVTYSTAVSGYVPADAPSGKVLQVVSTTKTDTFSTTSTSFTDVTGVTASITPSSISSNILVMFNFVPGVSSDTIATFRVLRDGTAVNIGDAAGTRYRGSSSLWSKNAEAETGYFSALTQQITFLDSPSTTSSVTYKLQMLIEAFTGGSGFVGRTGLDQETAPKSVRVPSTITLMEVAG